LVARKSRAWLLVLAMVGICGAALFGVIAWRARTLSPAELMRRLPSKDALILAVDFKALRTAGVLQMLDGSKMGQEADYQKFVSETQFNYVRDLDYALAAFGPTGKYILAKGRFNWESLRAYAYKQGGSCYNALCRMPGSVPERHISFFPVQKGLMALAVSAEDDAATRLEGSNEEAGLPTPDGAVWLLLPPAVLKSPGSLPEGTALFARSVDEAKNVTLSFSPENGQIAAKLNVLCKNDQDALMTTAELVKVTEVLQSAIAHTGHRANASDLSGVLVAGKFENKGPRVFGYWPIQRAFVENLLSTQ
jgi:hypothetical protein